MSADIAGNVPITIAALMSTEISALFTLSSPFWVILLRPVYHPESGWSIRLVAVPHGGEDNTAPNHIGQEFALRSGKKHRRTPMNYTQTSVQIDKRIEPTIRAVTVS